MNENARKIQNIFRNYLAKEKSKDLACKNNWDNTFRKLLNRNKIIMKIFFYKKFFDDRNTSLKRYMDKWRTYNHYFNINVNRIKNAFRIYLANKEKKRLKRNEFIIEIVNRKKKIIYINYNYLLIYGVTKQNQLK